MKANDKGGGERPDVTIDTARFRKQLLTKILKGDMTPKKKTSITHGERCWTPIRDGG